MLPLPPQLEPSEPSEPSSVVPPKQRIRKSNVERLISILANVRFWAGLSILLMLVSVALPWWGISFGTSSSWGLFFGPPSQQANVVFFQDRIDAALANNYSLMTTLVLLTALFTSIGAALKRWSILAISLLFSIITILAFLDDVAIAVDGECARTIVQGASCISGLVGTATSGLYSVTWGFESGFYTFAASAIILLGIIALHVTARE